MPSAICQSLVTLLVKLPKMSVNRDGFIEYSSAINRPLVIRGTAYTSVCPTRKSQDGRKMVEGKALLADTSNRTNWRWKTTTQTVGV
jgi:hypothetical protein